MAYKLTSGSSVIRLEDGACIPDDPANVDWQAYQEWVRDGNAAQPADPAPVNPPTPKDWLERLSSAKQSAISAAAVANPSILLWVLKAAGAGYIDVTSQETKDGVAALVTAGVIDATDQATLLAP